MSSKNRGSSLDEKWRDRQRQKQRERQEAEQAAKETAKETTSTSTEPVDVPESRTAAIDEGAPTG